MKKLLIIMIVISGVLITSAYVFFPSEVANSNIEKINCNISAANRVLITNKNWSSWWPGNIETENKSGKKVYEYNGYKYSIAEYKYNAIVIHTLAKDLVIDGTIFLIPLSKDSLQAEWKYALKTTSNPINRIHLYIETKKINKNIKDIMASMKNFLETKERVYGIAVQQIKVKDTILLATKFTSSQYPSLSKIYNEINGLKKYIASNKATETNFPMLNVWQDNKYYHTTIAIPIDKEIKENSVYIINRMVPGKILVTEIKGGENTVKDKLKQLEFFMTDYDLTPPAMPFQSLITNRIEEPDTTKWITKIYYPVY